MIKLTSSHTDLFGDKVHTYMAALSDRDIVVSVTKHSYGFTATESNYDGDEDKIRIAHSFKSFDDAIQQLIDKMECAIEEQKI